MQQRDDQQKDDQHDQPNFGPTVFWDCEVACRGMSYQTRPVTLGDLAAIEADAMGLRASRIIASILGAAPETKFSPAESSAILRAVVGYAVSNAGGESSKKKSAGGTGGTGAGSGGSNEQDAPDAWELHTVIAFIFPGFDPDMTWAMRLDFALRYIAARTKVREKQNARADSGRRNRDSETRNADGSTTKHINSIEGLYGFLRRKI
jgi:hypothetical protein